MPNTANFFCFNFVGKMVLLLRIHVNQLAAIYQFHIFLSGGRDERKGGELTSGKQTIIRRFLRVGELKRS